MAKPLHTRRIPDAYVHLLFEYLDARGLASESVLGQSRPSISTPVQGGIPVDRWGEMLERAAEFLKDPLLGLHLGQTIAPRHLGVLGYVIMACPNLAAALHRLDQYQRLIFDVTPMTQRAGDGYVELVWGTEHGALHPLVDQNGITVLVQFCRSMTGVQTGPLRIVFPNPQPADLQPYLDYFGCEVVFGGSETVVRTSLETLALPLKGADPGLVALMEQQADQLLAQMPREQSVIEEVRKVIAHLLRNGEPDIEAVAAKLCCASRTLQRRLKSAGSGFREELNIVRRGLADAYLRDPGLQIVDIALLLGYSEHSAFSRAYKEWTGLPPQQMRERSLAAA